MGVEGKGVTPTACLSTYLPPASIDEPSLFGPPTGNRPMIQYLTFARHKDGSTSAVVVLACFTHSLYHRTENSHLQTMIGFFSVGRSPG